jgi:hypothetical protein
MSTKTTGTTLLLCLAAAVAPAQEGARKHPQTLRDPEIYTLYHSDVSRPLHEMPVLEPAEEVGEERLHPVKLIRPPRAVPHGWRDPLEQAQLAAAEPVPQVSTTAGLSFDGVGVGLGSFTPGGAPPDTNGAPGATQYVQWVNTSFAVFDKATGALVFGPASGNTLWQGFGGPCETTNSGDPIAIYDKAANRWVMTQFSINQAANQFFQCVAVSTSSDATGSYRRFAYNFTGFNDYPKLGVWPDGYYITFNMFNAAGTAFTGGRVCALDRNQMLTASGTPGAIQCFQLSTAYGGLLPADLDGSTPPPAGSPNYSVAFDDANNDGLNLWKFHVDWANSANTTFTGPTKITSAAFSPACGGGTCIPQPSTTQRLDSLADRLMFRLAYRNFGTHESLVVNHSVTAGSAASGVRWYELRSPGGTPTLFQSGTFSPDATARWMGSIAQDKQGNMLLGYSASSSTLRPGIYYTGRLVSDAPGTMQAENTLTVGVGSQTGGLSRWGDYSAMTIDPVDDCTFWFTTEYLKSTGSFNWSTRIGSFEFPGCGGSATPDFTIAVSPSSLSIVQGGSGGSSVTVTSVNSFTATVGLSCSGLPAGVTCGFSPASVAPPSNGSAASALTVSVSAGTAAGSYPLQVTGTSGSLSHSTPLSLTVNPAGGGAQTAIYDATLKAPRCAAVGTSCDSGPSLLLGRNSKGPEPNQPNTIMSSCADGNSGSFHFDESNDRIKVSTLDGTAVAPGKTVKVEATVWAWTTPSSDHLDLYYAANAQSPAWTFIATLTPTAVGSQVLAANYTLPSGASQAVRARFRYNGSAAACGAGSYDDHDDLVFAVAPPPPDFSVAAAPSSLTIVQGASGTSTVTVSSLNGFGSAVGLSCSGLPSGVTCGFSPSSVTPPAGGSASSTLTVSVSASAAAGTSAFTVVGTSAGLTRSKSLSLTVTPAGGGPQTATYDAALKAPRCATVGSSCDSGPSLLLGRNTKGPEPNQPNTIMSSCADGNSGTFHFDESNDRLKLSTLDGTSFAPGKTVRIDATVWAWTTPSADHLDLYSAANAQSPSWTFVGTLTPTAAGAQTLSATYTLPAGTLQAVRAQFRYQGSASACTSGSYNDRDDLIFAVP